MGEGGGDDQGASRTVTTNYGRIAYATVFVNMILHSANAVDVHKAIKLADIGRRCISDSDLDSVGILF